MKKLITIFLFVVSFATYAVYNSPGQSNYVDSTGTVKKYDKLSIKVRNVTGSSVTKGYIVAADVTGTDDGIGVIKTSVIGQMPLCVMEETCADDAYCDCQVWGYNSAVYYNVAPASGSANNAAAAGDIGYANASGQAIKISQTSTVGYYYPIGKFIEAGAATGSIKMFLNMM